jgi:hypothetical protein
MHHHLHPSILEHARDIAERRNIPLPAAIDWLRQLRPAYFRDLPLFTRPREPLPPFAVTPHFVQTLKAEAKKLRKESQVRHAAALDATAVHCGFHDWKHVMKMAAAHEATIGSAIASGFVFAIRYPQHRWDTADRWNPEVLAPFGFVHDPAILFTAAEHLKSCYSNEDAEGGFYVLGFPERGPDGSITMRVRTEDYLDELRADVYVKNNLPDLHFFRYTGALVPASLDEARARLEAALGPVRWKLCAPGFPPEPISINGIAGGLRDAPTTPAPDALRDLPAVGDRSNSHKHIPIVHFVWLQGVFFELDEYTY